MAFVSGMVPTNQGLEYWHQRMLSRVPKFFPEVGREKAQMTDYTKAAIIGGPWALHAGAGTVLFALSGGTAWPFCAGIAWKNGH